jgi:hypothetical protein
MNLAAQILTDMAVQGRLLQTVNEQKSGKLSSQPCLPYFFFGSTKREAASTP